MITAAIATFTCSICGEPSHEICVFCTKDACKNHRCERCKRCSDCCECEVPLSLSEAEPEPEMQAPVPEAVEAAPELAEPVSEEASEERDLYSPPAMEQLAESGTDGFVEETLAEPAAASEPAPTPEEPRHEP